MKKLKPSPTAANGRDSEGKFLPGNKIAKGNPLAKRVQKLRSALLQAVTPKDIRAVTQVLLRQAKAGDLAACRELLDRVLGKPLEADVFEKIQEIERVLNELEK